MSKIYPKDVYFSWGCKNGVAHGIVERSYSDLANDGGPLCPVCDDEMFLLENIGHDIN